MRHLNHKQRWEFDELLLERWEAQVEEDTFERMEKRERYEQLHKALQDLPEMYRLVIWLHYFEDMPLKRIASFLGVPLTTVKWRMHEAKRMLKERMSRAK
jgi:RNA polymerase sigma-70 factor (ECF subfamily)